MRIWFLCVLLAATMVVALMPATDPIHAVALVRADERTGSGFAVDRRRIVTARHVVDEAAQVAVMLPTQSVHRVRSAWLSEQHDLAVLVVDPPLPVTLELDCLWPRRGTDVRIYGHPLGAQWVEHRGIVSSDLPVGGRLTIDAGINAGFSGGPVMANGRVVGMIERTLHDRVGETVMRASVALAVSGGAICQALEATAP